MSINKHLTKTIQTLSEQDLQKINKVIIGLSDMVLYHLKNLLKNQYKVLAPNIKSLRLSGFDRLNNAANDGILDLKDFEQLEQLCVIYQNRSQTGNQDNEFLYNNLNEITKIKSLKSLFLDLSNQRMEHYITEEIVKFVPYFQQLESLRIELGDNDIRDIGCENITKTISQLKNLRILQLGLESNNLGNYSFENVISALSELDNLEQCQLDFWNNYQDKDAFDCIKTKLQGKPICKNLKLLRLSLQGNTVEGEQLSELFEGLSELTNLQVCYIQINLTILNNAFAQSFNKFILANKDSLQTLLTEFNEVRQQQDVNFQLKMFENIDQIKNLTNLLITLDPISNKEYPTIQLFNSLQKCKQLTRLGIQIFDNELDSYDKQNKINYFKSIMDIDSLLKLEYKELNNNLEWEWYQEYFSKNWKLKHFFDPYLVARTLESQKDENIKDDIQNQLEELEKEEEFYEYSSQGSNSDSNSNYTEDYDSENSEGEHDDDSDLSSHSSEQAVVDDKADEQIPEKTDETEITRRQSIQIPTKQVNIVTFKNKTFEEHESKFDKDYKDNVNWKDKKLEQQLFLITTRQFRYKNAEFLRAIAYEKHIQESMNTEYSNSQILRNFWDLYF